LGKRESCKSFEEENMAQKNEKTVQASLPGADADNVKATIRWDVAKMQTTYANVCNVSSTREEFTLLFGINKTWNPEQRELTVDISDRVILNPFAAKRLSSCSGTSSGTREPLR
jgi:predicted ATPase